MPVTSSAAAAAAAAPPAAAAADAADASTADPSSDRPGPTATDGTNHSIMESRRRVTSTGTGGLSPEERKAKQQRALEAISDFLENGHLPADGLSHALLFLDVIDVPSTASACKDWKSLLDTIEGELWLGLVRKHCPIVEEITNLLPEDIGDDDSGSIIVVTDGAGTNSTVRIPAPSRNWKRQFQRRRLLSRSGATPPPPPKLLPPPKPLSSYFFQVDLVFYAKVEGDHRQRGEEIGVVSRIFRDVEFGEREDQAAFVAFEMKGLGVEEELSRLCLSPDFDIKVTIFDKSTGKQGLLYSGGSDGRIGRDWLCVGHDLDTPQPDYGSGYDLSSFVTLRGWCGHIRIDDTLLGAGRPCNECCPCDGPCSCSWDMTAELYLVDFNSVDDVGHLDATQHLRVIQDHVQFK